MKISIDFEKVCRLCFRDDDGQNKMTSMYERPDLEETIQRCVQIEVNFNMKLLIQFLFCARPRNFSLAFAGKTRQQ